MKGISPSRASGAKAATGNEVPRWEVLVLINVFARKGKSMAIVTVGIDLAKSVFAVHGVDATGKPALVRPSVPRGKLLELMASLPPCLVGMEACSGAHHWARLFQAHGHTVRMMAPKFVTPYRLSGKKGKNDAADAAAICEAVTRPSMRFVPPKSLQQQSELLVHRARQGFVAQRTATINRIRGLLSEFGVVLPLKAATVRREALQQLEDLPGWSNTVIGDLLSEVSRLDERIAQYDRHIEQIAKDSEPARQLMQLPGVGPTTATALVAMIGRGQEFRCGRQLSAWLGLVPGQYSSGGKQRLGRITKAGDPYLRMLLILGARSVLQSAKSRTDPISRWAVQLAQRVGYWKAIVAIAAKNARMCWAVLARKESFKLPA
jgi:transposase